MKLFAYAGVFLALLAFAGTNRDLCVSSFPFVLPNHFEDGNIECFVSFTKVQNKGLILLHIRAVCVYTHVLNNLCDTVSRIASLNIPCEHFRVYVIRAHARVSKLYVQTHT